MEERMDAKGAKEEEGGVQPQYELLMHERKQLRFVVSALSPAS